MAPDERDERQRFTHGEVMSKEMARHWGATYTLFRLFSTQSLGLMLPKQFRDYWSSLESWKKSLSTEQQTLLFAADPFQAQAQVKAEKEARAAKRERERQVAEGQVRPGASDEDKLPKRWKEAREVRMSKAMRDSIESVVRQNSGDLAMMDDYDDDGELVEDSVAGSSRQQPASSSSSVDSDQLRKQLTTLGFRAGYITSALGWLRNARSALVTDASITKTNALLYTISTQKDLDASLTYLTLYVPEEDLPQRFKAGISSEGFVTSAISKGKEDALKLQWSLDRLTKVLGFPKGPAEQALSLTSGDDFGLREVAALQNLLGRLGGHVPSLCEPSSGNMKEKRNDELVVVQSILGQDRVVSVPTDERPLGFSSSVDDCFDIIIAGPARAEVEKGGRQRESWGKEDIRLRLLWKHDAYPAEGRADLWPTFGVVSSSAATPALPSFLKLALTQHLLRQLATAEDCKQTLLDGQGGVVMAMVEELEAVWKEVVRGDKIKFEDIMEGFAAPSRLSSTHSDRSAASSSPIPAQNRTSAAFKPAKPLRKNSEVDAVLLEQHKAFQQSARGRELLSARNSLPIARHYDHIVATLASHRLCLLTGSTGSGKTTQLPQYILDSEVEAGRGSECKILVTQPRRVSAMSIAERVAHERGESIAESVGWAVRGERKVGKSNRILFTTTGLLLRRLQSEPDLASSSHLLIDEIHERSMDSDLLLLEVATLLAANPRLRVVLMSATLAKEKFVDYFSRKMPAGTADIGSIDVEGRIHPVEDFYLEDLIRDTGFRPSSSSAASYAASRDRNGPLKGLREHMSAMSLSEGAITALEIYERERKEQTVGPLDYELVGRAVQHVVQREHRKEQESGDERQGAVLVFMSGVGEIRQACEAIKSALSDNIEVMPLHSNLTNEEQQRVFRPTRRGTRKIVVATNVAEASITIDGVTVVVDTGRVKETSYDPESGLTRLVEKYTSRASAMQRRGRAGRTRPGECWKLFSRTLESRKMLQDGQPEMVRVPLESVILHVLSMNKNDVTSYLRGALDPPSLASISSAIANLFEAGAIRRVKSSQHLAATALGRHLSNLPLDLRLGKLLILGCLFNCLSPLLTVAAIMSCKPLFSISFERRDELTATRQKMAADRKSDLLTDAAFYDEWAAMRKNNTAGNAQIKQFVSDNYLSPSSLRDIASTRLDLLSNLQEIGFVPRGYSSYSSHVLDHHAGETATLRGLISAALWPSFTRIALPVTKFAESSGGAIAKEAEAKQVRLFDDAGRVFLHPSSVLFSQNKFDAGHLAVFRKSSSGTGDSAKVYLRDATEVPTYALLLFCGKLKVHHLQGGISVARAGEGFEQDDSRKGDSAAAVSSDSEGSVRLRAPARVAVLSAQLRRLLDAHLTSAFEGDHSQGGGNQALMEVLRALLERDGLSIGTI